MLPSHHKGRGQSKTNGVYICAVASLAICLLVTFRYWKREVGELLMVNERMIEQHAQLSSELVEASESLNQVQARVNELEEEAQRHDGTVAELRTSLEKEGAKASELQRQLDESAASYSVLEEEKTGTDSKLESCEIELSEKAADHSRDVRDLKEILSEANAKIKILSSELEEKRETLEHAQMVAKKKNSDKVSSKQSSTDKGTTEDGEGDEFQGTTEDQEGDEVQGTTEDGEGDEVQGATEEITATETRKTTGLEIVDAHKPLSIDQAFAVNAQTQSELAKTMADPLQLAAPGKQEAMPRDGHEDEIMFVKGGVEATTGIKDIVMDTTTLPNPRTGVQEAVPDVTLQDAVVSESKETEEEAE